MKETTVALENASPGLAEWVARAWADDLRQSRAALSAPEDKWR